MNGNSTMPPDRTPISWTGNLVARRLRAPKSRIPRCAGFSVAMISFNTGMPGMPLRSCCVGCVLGCRSEEGKRFLSTWDAKAGSDQADVAGNQSDGIGCRLKFWLRYVLKIRLQARLQILTLIPA
jgi:hypothetical protein